MEKILEKCFGSDGKHKGDFLVEIYRYDRTELESDVIYWCKNCGAVVVDIESDNRRMYSVRKMEFPKITLDNYKK